MKTLVFLFCATVFSLNPSEMFSQETVQVGQDKQVTVGEIFKIVKKQTDYRFIYPKKAFKNAPKIQLKKGKVNLSQLLNEILSNNNYSFELSEDNNIIIKKIESTKPISDVQKIEITGSIKDELGVPLPGANILEKGTSNGTQSDFDGNFTLKVSGTDAVLVISYIGFLTQEIKVGNQTSIAVALIEDSAKLDEVVVVGYGTQKKTTLTGAVSTVNSSEINEAPVTNVSNSLGGRLPGLVAVTGSGEPGADSSNFRIRGSNTFNNNSVLVVVDGVPGRSLSRIDPNSIESISVLKDASAAIYGARAANGVILVTTKRGKTGKPKLTVTIENGFNQPTKLPKMADGATYATLLNEVAFYENSNNGLFSEYTAEEIQKFRDGSDPLRYPNTDWFGTVLKSFSEQNSQNITVSGGTEQMKYFVSLGARHQDGNYRNSATYYNQYDFRSNIDGKISDNIKIGFDVAGRLEDRNFPIRSAANIFKGLVQSYPTSVAVWPNGEPGPAIEGGRNPLITSTEVAGYDRNKYYKLNSNLKLDIIIPWVDGLSFSGNLSYDQAFRIRKTFSNPFELYSLDFVDNDGNAVLLSNTYGGGANNSPSLEQSSRTEFNKLLYGVLNYETKIGDNHNLKLLLGSQVEEGNIQEFSAYRDLFLSNAIQELFAGQTANQRTDGFSSEYSQMSYFGRLNYNYADKYLVEFVGRYDGSYIFPQDNRFGFFPGVSLGWVASNEKFWEENLGFIDYFKLRSSWGQTGNDRVDAYQYLTSYLLGYQNNSNWNIPFVTSSGSELNELQTLYESVLANEDITWEVSNQFNIGFNTRFFDNKLSLEADYFYYRRSNILWPQDGNVPASAGISLPSSNYGIATNRGFDGVISYRDVTKGGLEYSVSFNGGYSKNKVVEWGETEGVPEWQQTTGRPMGSGLYYLTDGIYNTQEELDAHNVTYQLNSTPAPGDVKFIDYNEDGLINADDRVRIFKNNIPNFTFGANINLNYKAFDLSILLQGATGGVTYVDSEAGRFGNYFQSFADNRWTPDNPNASGPRTFNRGNWYWASNNNRNDFWLRKNDYIRLKTIQLGYNFPSEIFEKIGIEKFRVYLSGFNLLTYSPDLKEFDPELGANAGSRAGGNISGYNYPLQRNITMGFKVQF